MSRQVWPLLVLALLISLSACSADSEPVLPTARPTATITLTPTITPTPTVPTSIPTLPLIEITPTAGPSPTPLIGATPIVQQSASPTLAPRAALGSLNIEYFTTDAVTVNPGDAVTLYWSISGAPQAFIYRLNDDGSHNQVWQVRSSGTLTVLTRPTDTLQTRFTLSAGDTMSRIERTISVPLQSGPCDGGSVNPASKRDKTPAPGWFFAPGPVNCPAQLPLPSAAAQQNFEHGQMIWVGVQTQIYVLFNDGKLPAWNVYTDSFRDGQPERDPSLNPPANLAQPIRGFGLVWRTQPTVRDRLGWAIGSEQGFDGDYQADGAQPAPNQYLRLIDGSVVALSGGSSASANPKQRLWKAVPVTSSGAVPTGVKP